MDSYRANLRFALIRNIGDVRVICVPVQPTGDPSPDRCCAARSQWGCPSSLPCCFPTAGLAPGHSFACAYPVSHIETWIPKDWPRSGLYRFRHHCGRCWCWCWKWGGSGFHGHLKVGVRFAGRSFLFWLGSRIGLSHFPLFWGSCVFSVRLWE